MRRPMKLLLITAALALPVGLVMTNGNTPTAQSAPAETASEAQRVGNGTLQAYRTHELRVALKRYDGDILVQSIAAPGTRVDKGEVVASLELTDSVSTSESAMQEMEMAMRAVQAAEYDLNRHLNDGPERLARLEFDLQGAAADMQYWTKYGKADEIKRAEQSLQSHIDGIADQEDELNQLRELYKGNRIATESQRIVLDRAERRLQRAKESYEIAKHTNEWQLERGIPRTEWEKETRLRQLQARYERYEEEEKAALAKLEIALMKAEGSAKAAKRRLEEASNEQYSGSDIFAPASGVIMHGVTKDNKGVETQFHEGDRVSRNQVVATLLETDMLSVTVMVALEHLPKVRNGKLWIHCIHTNSMSPAVLDGVSGLVIDGKVAVKVLVANDDHALMPGMLAGLQVE